MASRTHTGGMNEFVYSKDHNPKNTPEQDAAMDEAWAQARKRKKRNKIVKWAVVILVCIMIAIYYWVW